MFPILIKLGSIEIRSYGVMIALAFVAGLIVGVKEAKRRGVNPDLIHDFLAYAMLGGILGARLYYVAVSEPLWYLSHPGQILAVWKGGLSIHGGIVGGLLAGVWFTRRRRLGFWKFADLLTPSLILGQTIGRLACVLNGCSYGKPAPDLPWAVVFTDLNAQAPLGVPLHPTQFYELFTDLGIFLLLWGLRKRLTAFDGQLFLIYGICYGVARFVLEAFRGDSLMLGDFMPVAQAMSLVILAISLALFISRRLTATRSA